MLLSGKQRGSESSEVYAALGRMPLFAGLGPESFLVECLGSLTNVTYKVSVNGESYALRLPGAGTSDYIDRAAEEHNARIASLAGVNPETLFFDSPSGVMLSRFVEGVGMSPERFGEEAGAPARAALALRRVHRLGRSFRSRFDVFESLGVYLDLLRAKRRTLPEGFGEVWRRAKVARRALGAPTPLSPCHNDPWPGNFVDTGERVYILDWEYSGMNDPLWDLADLSVEAGFSPVQDRAMMEAYFGLGVPYALYARLALYKAVSDLFWSIWALVQDASGNPRDDFLAYALARFERCRARMNAPGFSRRVNAVRGGSASNAFGLRPKKNPPRQVPSYRKGRETASLAGLPPSPSPSSDSSHP